MRLQSNTYSKVFTVLLCLFLALSFPLNCYAETRTIEGDSYNGQTGQATGEETKEGQEADKEAEEGQRQVVEDDVSESGGINNYVRPMDLQGAGENESASSRENGTGSREGSGEAAKESEQESNSGVYGLSSDFDNLELDKNESIENRAIPAAIPAILEWLAASGVAASIVDGIFSLISNGQANEQTALQFGILQYMNEQEIRLAESLGTPSYDDYLYTYYSYVINDHVYFFAPNSIGMIIADLAQLTDQIYTSLELDISNRLSGVLSNQNDILDYLKNIFDNLVKVYQDVHVIGTNQGFIYNKLDDIFLRLGNIFTLLNNQTSDTSFIDDLIATKWAIDIIDYLDAIGGHTYNSLLSLNALNRFIFENFPELIDHVDDSSNDIIRGINNNSNVNMSSLFDVLGFYENEYTEEREVIEQVEQYAPKVEIGSKGVYIAGRTGYEASMVKNAVLSSTVKFNTKYNGQVSYSYSYNWSHGATRKEYGDGDGIYYDNYGNLTLDVVPYEQEEGIYLECSFGAFNMPSNDYIGQSTFNVTFTLEDGTSYSYSNLKYPQTVGGDLKMVDVKHTETVTVKERLTLADLLYRIWQATKNKYEVSIDGSNVSMLVDMASVEASLQNLINWTGRNYQRLGEIISLLESLDSGDGESPSSGSDLSAIESRLDAIIALLGAQTAMDIVNGLVGDMDSLKSKLAALGSSLSSQAQGVFPFCIPAVVGQVLGLVRVDASLPSYDLALMGASLHLDMNSQASMINGFGAVTSWVCRITLVIVLLVNTKKFVYGWGSKDD